MRGTRPRPNAAVLAGRVGHLSHRPSHEQEQRDDREFQEHHKPDEGPRVHAYRSYTGRLFATTPDLPQGALLIWVIVRSCSRRASISSCVKRSTRSVPNSSTLKDASTVA